MRGVAKDSPYRKKNKSRDEEGDAEDDEERVTQALILGVVGQLGCLQTEEKITDVTLHNGLCVDHHYFLVGGEDGGAGHSLVLSNPWANITNLFGSQPGLRNVWKHGWLELIAIVPETKRCEVGRRIRVCRPNPATLQRAAVFLLCASLADRETLLQFNQQ